MLKTVQNEEIIISQRDQTGSIGRDESYKTKLCPFDKYVVEVRLSPENEFLGIEEIIVNKEFISYSQQNSRKGFHDVDDFYND